ncbi:MAG: hypothetical protein M3R47_18825 [Chloroflexota bacterium]|nr:hypothetical protein [Chloroflexota bacterium]
MKKLLLVFFTLFVTMCSSSTQVEPFKPIDGLSCGTSTSNGVACSYTCPDGETVVDFDEDPSLSATKGDLDRLFCGVVFPTFTPVATLVPSSPTPAETATLQASATAAITISPTSGSPLLTGQVTMCDTGSNLISFRIVTPALDLAGKTVTIVIADQESSSCTVNATNTSLLTCTIPPSVTFPAQVVVSLDGAVVNDFIHEGIGCTQITTPVVTTTP